MLQGSVHSPLPLWTRVRIDDEAIEHYRGIGAFTPAEDLEPLTVDLVQRDDLDLDEDLNDDPDEDPTQVRPHPAQVRVAGVRLSRDEALQLAGLLTAAVAVIDRTQRPPTTPRVLRSVNGGYGLAPVSPARSVQSQRRSA